MGKKQKDPSRNEQETAEGMPVVNNDAPSSRFQNKQQVQDSITGNDTEVDNPGFSKKKISHPGTVVKQDVVSRVISEASGGEVNAEGISPMSMSYGGNTGTISGSAAYTPKATQSRSDTRYGKRLDDTIKKLNFIPSEQVVVERDESKPIAESRSVQGYNGTYRNAAARAQKNNGGVPAATMFQRSLDEISRDQLYFCAGQTVKKKGVVYADTPTKSAMLSGLGTYTVPEVDNYTAVKRGNYLPRSLKVVFDKDRKKVKTFQFEVDDLSTELDDDDVLNDASTAELRHINRREVDRQKMDQKAGDEKADIWSPLPRAVRQPSETVAFLSDLEADTGDEVWFAYKKMALCLSYQLNRAAKDGLTVKRPMNEALLGVLTNVRVSTPYDSVNPFSPEFYRKGAASLALAAFDTTQKYATKGDLLALPKTFKSFMQIADNNMNPLRAHAEFIQAVNNREVFSTIDRPYDPLLPVFISDREATIHAYDWNALYSFADLDENGNRQVQGTFRYMYHDLRNVYTVSVNHPLLKGIADYLDDNAAGYIRALSGGKDAPEEGDLTMVIPIVHSTRYFSLWTALVLAATPYIIRERVNSMRDVLYYEKNVEYPFSHLVSIGQANPMNAVNYTNSDYQAPIQVGQMMNSTALTWVMPELFWPFDENTLEGEQFKLLMPWYFSQNEYKFDGKTVERVRGAHAITLPSIRTGIRLASADMLYSMEERDVRLSLDRLVQLPDVNTLGKYSSKADAGVYKYDQMSDGIPFFTYGSGFNASVYMALPREIGYFMVAPYGVLTPKFVKDNATNITAANVGVFTDIEELPINGTSSYTAKCWFGYGGTGVSGGGNKDKDTSPILKVDDINVNRSTAYVQQWVEYTCSRDKDEAAPDLGFALSMADLFDEDGYPTKGNGVFVPFTTGYSADSNGAEEQQDDSDDTFTVVSLQKGLWTRIQLLPFALSPWDCAADDVGETHDRSVYDPFDLLYAFGVCGFRASDYTEDVYNHDNMITNMGLTFLDDPWVNDSPIFKESLRLTES